MLFYLCEKAQSASSWYRLSCQWLLSDGLGFSRCSAIVLSITCFSWLLVLTFCVFITIITIIIVSYYHHYYYTLFVSIIKPLLTQGFYIFSPIDFPPHCGEGSEGVSKGLCGTESPAGVKRWHVLRNKNVIFKPHFKQLNLNCTIKKSAFKYKFVEG